MDSGADASIVKNKDFICDFVQYENNVKWSTANNEPLLVEGEGYLKLIPNKKTKVYYSSSLTENIISVSDYQRLGYNVIFPAESQNDLGAWIIHDKTNKILFKTNNDYIIDIQNYSGKIPENNSTKNNIRTVKSKIMHNSDIQHKVADWQRRLGYPTKNTLLKLQQNIDQFPLTENQIRKYYTQFPWFTMGRMTRSTFNEKDNIIEKDSHIGDIVATDAIPIKSYGSKYDSVHLFIDQKSKFCTVIFGLKNDGAKELATYTVRVKKQYEIYGHNLKKLQTDSLSAYQTTTFENILLHNNIIRRESSPLEHQQNGLVERLVRSMEENISSMRAAAPWVPKKYITFQIFLWVQLWNLQEGSMKNISRIEEFKN